MYKRRHRNTATGADHSHWPSLLQGGHVTRDGLYDSLVASATYYTVNMYNYETIRVHVMELQRRLLTEFSKWTRGQKIIMSASTINNVCLIAIVLGFIPWYYAFLFMWIWVITNFFLIAIYGFGKAVKVIDIVKNSKTSIFSMYQNIVAFQSFPPMIVMSYYSKALEVGGIYWHLFFSSIVVAVSLFLILVVRYLKW